MKTYQQLVDEALEVIPEVFPWDLEEMLESEHPPLVLDVRESDEYQVAHIRDCLYVPRGTLEQACEYNYGETIPELVRARGQAVVVVCRSGKRSALAALNMHYMGYREVYSLKTGLRGWNDYELPLVDQSGELADIDAVEAFFTDQVRADQMAPKGEVGDSRG